MADESSGKAEPSLRRRGLSLALVCLAALAAVLPEMVHGNSCGHDFNFHLVSWMDALRAWQSGIPYPHWAASANWGAGEPRFIFYPPLTWMLGAALGSFLPWAWVPTALTFVLLAATGLGARQLARQMLPETEATLAGCLAIFSGYALFTAYERTAFAELAGGFWMPLVLLFALRGEFRPGLRNWRSGLDRSAVWLAVAVAGAWLSNPTVGVMSTYLVMALALLTAGLERSVVPLVRAAVALLLGLGVTADYLAPVALEQGWADLNQVNLSPGQMLEHNWLFARNSDPVLGFHDEVLHQVSLIVVAMVTVTLAAALLCGLRKRLPGGRRWWLPMCVLPVAVLLLQLPLSLPLWALLPRLRYLQFPWRWLVTLEAPLAVFLVAALWPRRTVWRQWIALVGMVCGIAAAIWHAQYFYFQMCVDEDSVATTASSWSSEMGFQGTAEYVPPGAINSLVAASLPDGCLLRNAQALIGTAQPISPDADPDDDPPPPLWQPGQPGCLATYSFANSRAQGHAEHFAISGWAQSDGFLLLQLRRYPAWAIHRNGQLVDSLPLRADGLTVVPVKAGAFSVSADWQATPDVWLGRGLSFVCVLALTGLAWVRRRSQIE